MTDALAYALVMAHPGLSITIHDNGTWEARGPLEGVQAALNA